MALDVAALSADVQARTGLPADTADAAVAAAELYIVNDVGVPAADLPSDDPLLNPGAVLLAIRIAQDTATPGGNLGQFDPTFDGILVPKHLYAHLDEYWRHLRDNWGIA